MEETMDDLKRAYELLFKENARLRSESDALRIIYANIDYDGIGYWLPEWCISEMDENREVEMPTFDQFTSFVNNKGKS